MILSCTPNVKTLSSLIHASPAMHDIYAANRRRIFTQVTINGMIEKEIDIKPAPVVGVRVALSLKSKRALSNKQRRKLRSLYDLQYPGLPEALKSLYHQMVTKTFIELEIDQCKVLKCLTSIVRWDWFDFAEEGDTPDYRLDRVRGIYHMAESVGYYRLIIVGEEFRSAQDQDLRLDQLDIDEDDIWI